jgi:hypothetical protein
MSLPALNNSGLYSKEDLAVCVQDLGKELRILLFPPDINPGALPA